MSPPFLSQVRTITAAKAMSGRGAARRRCLLAAWVLAVCIAASCQARDAEPWPTGSLTRHAASSHSGPEGYHISGFQVTCPGVEEPMQGLLAVASHRGTARGLVVFFTGGNGNEWWTGEDRKAIKLAEELRNAGFVVVQVKWNGTWHHSSPGDDAGTAHLACRPATVIRHVYEEYYQPLKIRVAEPGRAGFCITGNSAAASQVAYALSHYGLDGIVNLAIPTGGPSHSVLAKSMLEPSDERRRYGYPRTTRTYIDKSFGYFGKDGPGRRQDADFRGRWTEESVATGGSDYHHPTTRVHFIFGEHDRTMQTVGRDYFDRLQKEGSPMLVWQLVPDTGHSIEQTAAGREALKAAILGIGRPGSTGRAGQAATIRSNREGR